MAMTEEEILSFQEKIYQAMSKEFGPFDDGKPQQVVRSGIKSCFEMMGGIMVRNTPKQNAKAVLCGILPALLNNFTEHKADPGV